MKTKKKKKKKKEEIEEIEEIEDVEITDLKVKEGTCWFCIYANDNPKDSVRCRKCVVGTKNGFKKAGKRIMKQREEDLV